MDVTDTTLERDLLMLNLKLKLPLIQAHGTDIHTDTVTTDTASNYHLRE